MIREHSSAYYFSKNPRPKPPFFTFENPRTLSQKNSKRPAITYTAQETIAKGEIALCCDDQYNCSVSISDDLYPVHAETECKTAASILNLRKGLLVGMA